MFARLSKWLDGMKAQQDEAKAMLSQASETESRRVDDHGHEHEHFDGVVHEHEHGHADHDHRHDHNEGFPGPES